MTLLMIPLNAGTYCIDLNSDPRGFRVSEDFQQRSLEVKTSEDFSEPNLDDFPSSSKSAANLIWEG
jgi:hypothetical protein